VPVAGAAAHSIFNRDHPGCAENRVIGAFAQPEPVYRG
jgi:hypothetical protein